MLARFGRRKVKAWLEPGSEEEAVGPEKVAFRGTKEAARLMDFGLEMPHTCHHNHHSRAAEEEGVGLLGVHWEEAEKEKVARVEEQNS